MYKLKVFQIIENNERNSSIDVFRSLAIISVVIYHFNSWLKFGYLGVDLFFLISGLLVGGLLTKDLMLGNKIKFSKFFFQRAFKIWPSYYAFLLFGGFLAFYFYNFTNPEQLIPKWDLKRYLFFYQNYTGTPFHWSFDHVWSLCVEEHFYVLLPILYLIIQNVIPEKYRVKLLFIFVFLVIIAGVLFKVFSYYYTNGQDTYSATHNRIDALAWGVLLNLIIKFYPDKIKKTRFVLTAFTGGALLFIFTISFSIYTENILFDKLFFHDLIPISFFLMLLSMFFLDFSKFRIFRFIAYYSYNWYLWHPIFVIYLTKHFGNTLVGLVLYLLITFTVAVFATILIEEPFLKIRKLFLLKVFNEKN